MVKVMIVDRRNFFNCMGTACLTRGPPGVDGGPSGPAIRCVNKKTTVLFLRHGIQYLGAGFRVCGSGDHGPHGCAAKARHPGECARPMVQPYC